MTLLEFINYYEDWEERLSQPPYNLSIKTDGEYKLLKYNQIDSDFNYNIVQEARGCIVKQDFDGEWIYVCRPFKKFFNYGEPQAAHIDWRAVEITEKIDGSLIKVWYDNNEWHVSTSGTINAFEAYVNGTEQTFGELFRSRLGGLIGYFAKNCNLYPACTYLFELTSPETRIVIPYSHEVYFLTSFDNETGEEIPLSKFQYDEFKIYEIKFPEVYEFNSLEEVITYAEKLDSSHEGFVIADFHGNRVKVKSPEYLRAAHLFAKGYVGKLDLLQMIKKGTIDDFIGYFPEYRVEMYQVYYDVNEFIELTILKWIDYGNLPTRKEFAEKVKNLPMAALLFKKYTNPDFDIHAYIWNEMDYKKLGHILRYDEEMK